ncbi:MAG: hypothetical protein IH614_07730, partial [Desulfuromonadales bacterium]|nr:hypothetical protein [Desulfuromonadales bacterium]
MRFALGHTTILLGTALALALPPVDSFAIGVDFKGRVQSTFVLRDNNGFQNGVMDKAEGVQWRNELKFDVEITPEYPTGKPPVRLEKFYLVYRGAYDAIFDVRQDRFSTVREKSPDDFEYGRDDLKWENDLREAFVDFRGEWGQSVADLRIGRQVVQWGEADGFNLMNIVNPQDNRFLMFFDNPEDLANPLWMGKLELTRNQVGPFHSIGLQLLAIPDVRPNIFAPLDGTYDAPYAFFFKGLQGLTIKEDVPSSNLDNMEYGARLGASWADSTAFLYYFKGIQDAGVLDLSTAATGTVYFKHPETKTYGASFNTFLDSVNAVFRGEASYTDGQNFADMGDFGPGGKMRGYSEHDYYQALLGIDKDFTNVKLGTN